MSIEWIVGTSVGASVGAIESTYFGANLIAFAIAISCRGYCCSYGDPKRRPTATPGITLTIIVLIPRNEAPLITATHHFIEVSLGIPVGLAVAAVWREEQDLRSASGTD